MPVIAGATQIGADGRRHPTGTQPLDPAPYRRRAVVVGDLQDGEIPVFDQQKGSWTGELLAMAGRGSQALNVRSYCSGSGEDESTQFQNAVNDSVAANKWLYLPSDLAVYVGNHVTQMPNGFRFLMDGVLWTDSVIGDGAPDPAFAFLENLLWQTAGPSSDITIIGNGEFRRTVDITGLEGPQDRAVRIRNGRRIKLDVTTRGGLGGVIEQGCDDYHFKVKAYNPGDSGVANDQNFGVARCQNGYIEAVVYNAGFLLDGVTPTPNGINGSSLVITQHGTRVKAHTVNPRYTAFETGDQAKHLFLEIDSYVDLPDRQGDIGLANCSDITLDARIELHNGGVGKVHVVSPVPEQTQERISIHAVGKNDYVANGFEVILVRIGAYSHDVTFRADATKMAAFMVGGADISGITIQQPESVSAPRFGGYLGAGIMNCHVIDGFAHKPGTDSTAQAVFRTGLVIDQVGAGCSVEGYHSLDEGAGTMAYGYYSETSTLAWARNRSVGHTISPIYKGGTVTLVPPVDVA